MGGVAKGYRPVLREQGFLLPVDMREWLPADHLVWFVIDTVAALDTGVLHARAARTREGGVRRSAAGRAGFDPDLLLTLLIYGYAVGVRSSRQLERLCATDVAFRIVCGGAGGPDHTVLARFRQAHQDAVAGLFTQVLVLCARAGLGRVGTVAIDGTKIAANASRQANRTEARLRAAVEQILAEAAATDADQDARFGADRRGDELPPPLADPNGRVGRLRRCLAQLAAERAAADTAERARAAEQASAAEQALAAAQAAEQAAQQAQQAKLERFERAWEQGLATGGSVPKGRAPAPVEQAATVRRARIRTARAADRLATARHRLTQLPSQPQRAPRANVTDPDSRLMKTMHGWLQAYNGQLSVSADQLILATDVVADPFDVHCFEPMLRASVDAARLVLTTRRGIDPGPHGGIDRVLADAGYHSTDNLTTDGPPRLIALGKAHAVRAAARDNPATGHPPPHADPTAAMDHHLRTRQGAATYRRRAATVEPAIGNLKKILTRFSRRGLTAAKAELTLAATTFNLLKLHRRLATS